MSVYDANDVEITDGCPFFRCRGATCEADARHYRESRKPGGFVVGPAEVMIELRKVSTHTFYSTPTAAQIAAIRTLEGYADEWLDDARTKYAELGRMTAEKLGVEPPQGSAFLFLDVGPQLDDRGLEGFLEDCVDHGLFLAPGPSFGPYPNHARLCFTAAAPDVTERGVEVLASLLGRPD